MSDQPATPPKHTLAGGAPSRVRGPRPADDLVVPDLRRGRWRMVKVVVWAKRSRGAQEHGLNFTDELENQIISEARIHRTVERVGVVVKLPGQRRQVIGLDNVSKTPDVAFELSPEATASLYRMDRDHPGSVHTLWHSHPRGSCVPSRDDKAGMPAFIRNMAIVLPESREIYYYNRFDS